MKRTSNSNDTLFVWKATADKDSCAKIHSIKGIKWFIRQLTALNLQGFIRLVARVGSGDPVRVLRLYTTITLDEVCSIYC